MASILRTMRFSPAFRPMVQGSTRRTFGLSSVRASKEGDRDSPTSAEDSEKHKQDSLQKQSEKKGHWKAELASDSEEAVNADRHTGGHSQADIKEMQKNTVDHVEKKHKSGGTSQDSGLL